jgi:hypothetical protein
VGIFHRPKVLFHPMPVEDKDFPSGFSKGELYGISGNYPARTSCQFRHSIGRNSGGAAYF